MEEIDAVYAKARVERSNAIRQLIAAPIARGVKSVWHALTGRLDHPEKPTATGRVDRFSPGRGSDERRFRRGA